MNKNTIKLIAGFVLAILPGSLLAATIPTGTTLTVQTSETLSAQDRVGKKFNAQLEQDVTANGKIILPKGTKAFGTVASSRASTGSQSRPLSLNLTSVYSQGRQIAIVTEGPFEAERNLARTGRRGRVTVTDTRFTFPSGSTMRFRLAKPVTL